MILNPPGSSTRATGPRADARRSIEKIVGAAVACLGADSAATAGEIAQRAGVGRVTLYAHFPSRAHLVEAALARALDDGEAVLGALDLTGHPQAALRVLIEASWRLTARAASILEAALTELTPGRIRELHATAERRVAELIERGRAEGVFRTDIPVAWLASTMHHLVKGAAADVASGRLHPDEAGPFITAAVLGAFAPPAPDAEAVSVTDAER